MDSIDVMINAALLADIPTRSGIWIHNVTGIDHAVYSCTKPYNLTSAGGYTSWLINTDIYHRAYAIADTLAWRNNGESKFLRMIHLNAEIRAPRAWWSHMDTYKVGTVAQSESTMHSLAKRPMTIDDCEIGTTPETVVAFNKLLADDCCIDCLKYNMPEGFLQSRVVDINYATLQTIWYQRHVQEKLGFWKIFLGMYPVLPHSEWIFKVESDVRRSDRRA